MSLSFSHYFFSLSFFHHSSWHSVSGRKRTEMSLKKREKEREETDASKKYFFSNYGNNFLCVREQQLQGIFSCWIALSLSYFLAHSLSFYIDEMCVLMNHVQGKEFSMLSHIEHCVFFIALQRNIWKMFWWRQIVCFAFFSL